MKKSDMQIDEKQFNHLIKAIAQKDKKALEVLYNHFGRLIYITAATITHASELADEVVNDVLIKIWRVANTIKKIKNPRGWLYIITANCAKDRIKSEKETVELFDMSDNGNWVDSVLAEDAFYREISVLNEVEQQIMILRFIEDLSFEKIAKELKKSLSSVTSIYYRAIEKIKK